MDESELTTTSPKRFEYSVNTIYSVHADDGITADKLFDDAREKQIFTDQIIIAQEIVRRIEEVPDGGERHWVWNNTLAKWELSRYSLS